MRDVFISHADEDAPVALALARGLNAAGYTTWCYEDDSDPGPSYLSQIDEQLEGTQAVILIISPSSLESRQVVKEVVRAHEAGKPFIPLRRGVEHDAVHRQRDFRMALGAAVSIAVPDDGIEAVLPRVIRGLERSGVRPGVAVPTEQHSSFHSPPVTRPTTVPPLVGSTLADNVIKAIDSVSHTTRMGIVSVVGILGVIGSVSNVMAALNPTGQAAQLYRLVPTIGTANLLANLAGLALNLALLFSVWEQYSGRAHAAPRIRFIASLLINVVIVWLVVVVMSAAFPPGGRLRSADRLPVIGGTILFALIAGIPAAFVRRLYGR